MNFNRRSKLRRCGVGALLAPWFYTFLPLSVAGQVGEAELPAIRLFTLDGMSNGNTVAGIDPSALSELIKGNDRITVKQCPLEPRLAVDLELKRFRVTNSNTRFVIGSMGEIDRDAAFDPESVVLLRGEVIGEAGSDVFLAISERGVSGFVARGNSGGRYRLASIDDDAGANPDLHRISVIKNSGTTYLPADIPFCGTDTLSATAGASPAPFAGGPAVLPKKRVIELAVDTDYDFFFMYDNLEAAYDYIIRLYGEVNHIYLRDLSVEFILTYIRLWDHPDDLYNDFNPIDSFQAHWNSEMESIHRDTAQLLSGRHDLPYFGIAYLNGLCNSLSYSVCGQLRGALALPNMAAAAEFDVLLAAHEIGHSCGTVHTHDLAPPIDECPSGQVTRGTVMSYCGRHPGGTDNIDSRFHVRIQSAIRSYIGSVDCLIDDCNLNGIDDGEDIERKNSKDVDANGVPDECEDCNGNGELDVYDFLNGAPDVDNNGVLDECEPDCNKSGFPDAFDIFLNQSDDLNGNNVPDECEEDCDESGQSDHVEISAEMTLDVDRNAVLDQCQDCDGDGVPDHEELNGANNIWVATVIADKVTEFFAANGVAIRESDDGHIFGAEDLIIDDSGRILVSDDFGYRVVEFDRHGTYVRDLVEPFSGGLEAPTGLLMMPNGNLLVSSFQTDSVIEYDGKTGAPIGEFVTPGAGGLDGPHGLALGPNGNLYVSSFLTDRVIVYDGKNGAPIGPLLPPDLTYPLGPIGLLFKTDGNLLVAASLSNAVYEYDPITGEYLGEFLKRSHLVPFEFDGPHTLRIGPNGLIYVSSSDPMFGVQVFDQESGLVRRWFRIHSGPNNLFLLSGFDFMPGHEIDCNLNQIQDDCDIADGTSLDINKNGMPDECESLADFDDDNDIDLFDYDHFLSCSNEPDESLAIDCNQADLDGDGIVGLSDFGTFMRMFTGDCTISVLVSPSDAEVCLGDTAEFAVSATGEITGYQWYRDGVPIPGANDPTLTVENISPNMLGRYIAAVRSRCSAVQSQAAVLSKFDPAEVVSHPVDVDGCQGTSVQFSIDAEGTKPLTYQWLHNGTPIPGATESVLEIPSMTPKDVGQYWCNVIDACGTLASSEAAELSANDVEISASPADGDYCTGDTIFLTVSASGALSFQWYHDDKPIEGATAQFLIVSNAAVEDSGDYHVAATNKCGTVNSEPAVISVSKCSNSP